MQKIQIGHADFAKMCILVLQTANFKLTSISSVDTVASFLDSGAANQFMILHLLNANSDFPSNMANKKGR